MEMLSIYYSKKLFILCPFSKTYKKIPKTRVRKFLKVP